MNIVLIGGGAGLHCVIDVVEKINVYNIVGIIDSKYEIGTDLYGHKVIGRQEDIEALCVEYDVKGGVITIGDNWSRYHVYNEIRKCMPDFNFVNAIHPSCIIGKNVTIGVGVVAMAGCIFNPGSFIGDFSIFLTGAQVEHDCYISEFASLSAGSVLGGYVKLGKFSAITLNVTVLDRLEIGENTVIGSGSLVLKSLPSNVLVYGNPAKIIRTREERERFLK
jgi:sugar O-acyltransferase (sialic acid O-acetyltransferase NeuD family)